MIGKIILILIVALLAIKIYQYIFQNKPNLEKNKKKKSFNSIKKDDVKDAEFEDIKGDDDV